MLNDIFTVLVLSLVNLCVLNVVVITCAVVLMVYCAKSNKKVQP